jgi:DNA-binding NtrC family response regulator/tetratricopeptide (TPR) repeat protein
MPGKCLQIKDGRRVEPRLNHWWNLHHLIQLRSYHTAAMPPAFAELLGQSPVLVGLRRQLEQLVNRYSAARRLPPVLLLGETGTGKSLIARTLHAEGPRAGRPFVDINCAAIPESLMEAEMFGFERGAFTDARQSKPGLFVAADRGTIFLDEIGLLPENLQAKLLKVVEEQQVRPLGGTAIRPVDVWIIAATSEDLEVAIRRRRFREDLYHRLAVVALRVPSLRERDADVILLAEKLLARACADYGLAPKSFTRDAVAALRAHRWPGNIRELANVVERVALLSESSTVTADALGLNGPVHETGVDDPGGTPWRSPIDETVAAVERDQLLEALASERGNVTRAARRLGLTRNTLRYRLRKHGLAPAELGETAAERPPEPVLNGAIRWERRRVTCLRLLLVPGGEDSERRQHALLEEACQKMVGFGGVIEGVGPTGLTAVFGLDFSEDGPRRAAHAAMTIRNLGAKGRELDPAMPAMRLAIHGTHAMLGSVDSGVHVDMAARQQIWQALEALVSAADDGSILVSGSVGDALKTSFSLGDPMEGHGGACLLLDAERPAPWTVTRTVFVGREDEMAILERRLERVREASGQVVAISGEPGIGKSRLLHEFRVTLDGMNVGYLSARSLSFGRELPLLPIIELVRRAGAVEEGDSPTVIAGKVLSPYLLRLIGIDEGTETIRHLSPDALHQGTLEAFREILLEASDARPMVVAVEDLHWMDRASEGYLAVLVNALPEAPILLVTTQRPGYRAPWSDRSYVTELKLQPLRRAEARRVLEAALDREPHALPLADARAEAILTRADGNPFFIEELARAVGSTSAPPSAPVPESVEAVLIARIDLLPEEPKSLLQAASVLGRDVPVSLLEAIVPPVPAFKEHLRELHRLEYLHERSAGVQTLYRFKHALTQEVAYSSVLPDQRRALHARIVGAIESRHAQRISEYTEQLAHHAVRGQLWRKALGYLRQTAAVAVAKSAVHEAVASFDQALEVLTHLSDEQSTIDAIDVRLEAFWTIHVIADYRRCLDLSTEAADLAERLGERQRLGRALSQRCGMLRVMGRNDDAIAPGRRALEIAAETGDTALATTTNFWLGTAHASRGEFHEAVTCYRAAMSPFDGEVTADNVASLQMDGNARAWLSWVLIDLGQFTEALTLARRGLEIARMRESKFGEAGSACMLGKVYIGLGATDEAIEVLEPALKNCRAYDVHDWLAPLSMCLGYAYGLAGRTAEGIAHLEEGAAHGERIKQWTNYPARLATLADVYGDAGRQADAEATARRALALAVEQRRPPDEAISLHILGRVTCDEAILTRARNLAASLGMRPQVAHCYFDLGKLCQRAGRNVEARDHLATAESMYRALNTPIWLARMERLLAELEQRLCPFVLGFLSFALENLVL